MGYPCWDRRGLGSLQHHLERKGSRCRRSQIGGGLGGGKGILVFCEVICGGWGREGRVRSFDRRCEEESIIIDDRRYEEEMRAEIEAESGMNEVEYWIFEATGPERR